MGWKGAETGNVRRKTLQVEMGRIPKAHRIGRTMSNISQGREGAGH